MERIMSPEERIRRAEEVYYRRKTNSGSIRMASSQVKENGEKKQYSLYKKLVIKILICILIYLIFSLVKEANYIFSEEVMNKTKEFLSKDINFGEVTSQITGFFQQHQDKFSFLTNWFHNDENAENNQQENSENSQQGTNQENNQEQGENTEKQNQQTNNNTNQSNENSQTNQTNTPANNAQSQNNETTGIGGGTDENTTVATSSTSNSAKKTQMELDAEYIKKNFSLQLPLKATVTSRYGKREPTEIVSENHQGIDIGVVEGTTIVAAMEGTVSVVSDEGEYGTHVKIVNKDITTIYAHCSKILVKEGAKVKKGQKIALSGNTGKTTGPHLHFEIRRGSRTVDPELVLSWK